MSWYPPALVKEIRPGLNDPPIKVVGAILHVDAGNNSSLYSYFNGPSDGIESHFHIRKDGTVEQYRQTDREADANLKANSFMDGKVRKGFVSIETQGYEKGEWTASQLASIKSLLRWLSAEHGFPLKKAEGAQGPGVGYHTMLGSPGPWTPVSKSCPGPDRIKQFKEVILPWFDELAKPAPKRAPGKGDDDDMPSADEIAKAVWNYDAIPHNVAGAEVNTKKPADKDNPTWRPSSALENAENLVRGVDKRLKDLELKVDALIGLMTDDGR